VSVYVVMQRFGRWYVVSESSKSTMMVKSNCKLLEIIAPRFHAAEADRPKAEAGATGATLLLLTAMSMINHQSIHLHYRSIFHTMLKTSTDSIKRVKGYGVAK